MKYIAKYILSYGPSRQFTGRVNNKTAAEWTPSAHSCQKDNNKGADVNLTRRVGKAPWRALGYLQEVGGA